MGDKMPLNIIYVSFSFFSANQKRARNDESKKDKEHILKKVFSPVSLRILCIKEIYDYCYTKCNSELRELFVKIATIYLNMLINYAHFKFIENPSFQELDAFQMAEEVFDQRNFEFIGTSTTGDYLIAEIIRRCGFKRYTKPCFSKTQKNVQ